MNRRAAIALALFAVALAVYVYKLPYRIWAAGGDTTPAELLPISILGDHDLHFDEFVQPGAPLPYWFTRRDGHVISAYPIVPGLMNVPVYAVARAAGVPFDQFHRSMLSAISGSILTAASVAFFFLAVSRMTRRATAIAATFLYAFATTAFSVAARGIWQHGPSLLFLTLALWLLTRGSIAASALPLGFAVWNRPVNIAIVLPLALYVAWQHRGALGRFLALAAIPAMLMVWYSIAAWGSITSLGQYSAEGRFNGHFGEGFAGILVNPNRGLLVFTPLFILALIAVVMVLMRPRAEPLLTALAVGVVLTLLLYAKWDMWWGGSCFGYRLLTELVPSLMLILAVTWDRGFGRSMAVRAIAAVTAALSIYINTLGAFYAPCGFDTVPNEINHHLERLWDVRDGEIARCSAKLLGRAAAHFHR
jgi:hypothetical protein